MITADLTQSFPVYKEHQRAWTLKNYDDDGTHSSTIVDGKRLKLRNNGSTTTPSYSSGYWLSDPWNLSSITNVEDSFIEYCVCARNGADVLVKTAITTSTSTPADNAFTVASTTTTIPGISAGSNLSGKYLWLKIEMTPSYSATGTPCLCRINLGLNNVGTTTTAHNVLQSLAYTYDTVGNITQIKDISGFGGDKTVAYVYDDLYRLTNASTTLASRGNYNQTFAYSSIGNITSAPLGTYSYSETGFANPHAATQIGATSLTYDNNGNVTDYGTDDYVWNYRDRLTKSIVGEVTTLYGYDFNNDRVTKGNGTATTTYANRYFNQKGATTTKHIYDNAGLLLATIEGNGTATSTNYIHTDHLGGTSIVTGEEGDVVEAVDYYPYGSQRINMGTFTEQRKFIGEQFDGESSLSYLNARYYSGDRGQFMSQDPVAKDIATLKQIPTYILTLNQQPRVVNQLALLSNPQLLNSYSYSANNPITQSDPSGKLAGVAALPYLASIGPAGWVAGGALVVGSVILSETILHNSGWGERYGGTVPTLDPAKMGFGQPPMGLEDMPPPSPNSPNWAKWIYKALTGAGTLAEIIHQYENIKEEVSKVMNTDGPQDTSPGQNKKVESTSPQPPNKNISPQQNDYKQGKSGANSPANNSARKTP